MGSGRIGSSSAGGTGGGLGTKGRGTVGGSGGGSGGAFSPKESSQSFAVLTTIGIYHGSLAVGNQVGAM